LSFVRNKKFKLRKIKRSSATAALPSEGVKLHEDR